jgi:hypothetical protein
VESGVKYVNHNFVPLRDFHSAAHSNELLRAWVMIEADNRIHGSTRERPLKLIAEAEQTLLQALPAMVPRRAPWAIVKLHPNCQVQFNYCSYSAPFRLMCQTLWLEITNAIRIYRDHQRVGIHPDLFKHGDVSTVRGHLPPDAQAYLMRIPQWRLAQAKGLGPACQCQDHLKRARIAP